MNRLYSVTLVTLTVLTALFAGCGDGTPSENEFKQAIDEALRVAVPLDLLQWQTASKAKSIEEIKILEISAAQEGDTPVGKVPYWLVWAQVKGECQDVFETKKQLFPFEGRAKFYVFRDERSGKLVANKDKIF